MMAGCHSVPHPAVMDDASLNSFKCVLLLLLIRYPGSGIHEHKEIHGTKSMRRNTTWWWVWEQNLTPSFPREAIRS